MMLGSDEHHLVTPEASELESSVLPPLLHISRYIYRHCHGVLDLHPDLGIYLKEYLNIFKELYSFDFCLFLILLHCSPKMS